MQTRRRMSVRTILLSSSTGLALSSGAGMAEAATSRAQDDMRWVIENSRAETAAVNALSDTTWLYDALSAQSEAEGEAASPALIADAEFRFFLNDAVLRLILEERRRGNRNFGDDDDDDYRYRRRGDDDGGGRGDDDDDD